MYTHDLHYTTAGSDPAVATGALLLIHGRGGTALDILRVGSTLKLPELSLYAPQASHNSWYPHRFIEKESMNEPALSSALDVIGEMVSVIHSQGFPYDKIVLAGFSQGACLASEYVARHNAGFGGLIAFTGGLIGDELNLNRYQRNFDNLKVLLSTGDPDIHVPLQRVRETGELFEKGGANVELISGENKPHSISYEEIVLAKKLLKKIFSGAI